jgi:DNA repair and recombination protein RAD52
MQHKEKAMFNDKQAQVLAYELDNNRIKSRTKGNVDLSYLEGFDIIEAANKIFGFGNWTYAISALELVSQESNQNQNSVICYKAIVNIVVHDLQHSKHISREDVGFGTGIAKSLADAHESAGKEAVTDALKRAFRSFGNQFGNSLYDKSRVHQNQQPTQLQQQTQQPSIPQRSNNIPQDYASLYNLGLSVVNQGEYLIVIGDDLFGKKDSIKSFGFRWDSKSKQWYKSIEQQSA